MAHRQRNIQSTGKESVQIQTDAVLVNDQQLYGMVESVNHETHTHTMYSQISSHSGLLRPFSDKFIYRGLQTAMQEIREFTTTGETDQKRKTLIQKRLCSLEQEIDGLLKRDLLVTGKDDEYYKILSDKDSEITHVEFKTKYNFVQLEQMKARIRELEDEIVRLNRNVKSYQLACDENQHYRQYFEQLKNTVNSSRGRPKDLEKLIDEKIIPEIREFEINFSQITTRINKNVKGSVRAKNLLIQHIRDIEKLFSREELTEANLEEVIESFYLSNTYLKGSEEFERRRFLSEKVTKTEERYQMLVSVLRDQVQKQKKTDSAAGFFELEKLLKEINVREGVEFVNCNGWVGIGKIETERTVEIPVQDVRTKQLITLLGREMKKITERYPKLKDEISVGLREFLELQILEEAVEVDSLDRIKQIIIYHNDIVRVDNVYSYSSEKDKQLIYHLRVLIKTLLEELEVIKTKFSIDYSLDEGILGLLRAQVIEGIDIDAIISLYRPLPKTIEVEKIIQKPVYVNGTLEKGIPIRVNKMHPAQTIKQQAVEVVKEVPVFIEVQRDNIINKVVEVGFETEKVVEVPTVREMGVEKILVNEVLREIEREKIIAIEQEVPVEMKSIQEVVVEVPRIHEIEKPIPLIEQKLVEVEVIKEVPVYLYEKVEKIKEVEVTREKLFKEKEYHQIERMVPHIINTTQVVNIEREVPVYITNTEEKPVHIREIVEKAVPYRVLEEKIVELPLIQEKEVIKEIEKEILVDVVHFVKGDREEIFKEVEIRVEKPIIHERIVTKDVEIEKMVPLYIREEKPVICEIMIPYPQVQVKIINNEVVKMVPVKEEVIKEVEVETPVPVIVEKEIVKVETVIVEKIVEKIVEVPRVVEIEKIVERIVVVPRIIQEIVEVPRIVEKVVVIETPVLQIVEVIREVPVIQTVEVIKEVIVPETRVEIVKEYEVIEKEKLVQITVETQVPKEVYLERFIPTEVLREFPQEVYIDKLVDRVVEINEVTVKDREVPVIVTHQEPVPMIIQKPFITQKVIENIVEVETIKTVEVPILRVEHTPQIVEITAEKPVVTDIVKEVPGPEKIIYTEVPVEVQLIKEVVVEVEKVIEQPREVYLTIDKVVHQIHDKLVTLPVTQMINKPEIIEINKPKHFIHYKEVPVHVPIDRQIPVRSVYDQPKYVQLTTQNNVVTEVVREKTKEIVNEIKQYLTTEVVKEIHTEKPILEESLQIVEVQGDTKLIETHSQSVRIQEDYNLLEKVVERIIMLPQIVQVVKHVHDIAEVQSLGIATNVEIETHTSSYIGISTELRKGLIDLMEKFKVNAQRQPDLRVLITVIEKYIGLIDDWIRFPKIIETIKEVEKVVEKEKVVLVPTEDKEKNATLSFIVEQLIIELKRVKDKHRIDLNLDENITKLFFTQNKFDMGLVSELTEELKRKHEYFGSWSDSHPFIVSAFLEEHFTMKTVVDEANLIRRDQEQIINELKSKLTEHEMALLALRCGEEKLKTNYKELVTSLKNSATRGVGFEEIRFLLDNHEPLLTSILSNTREVEYSYEERRVTTSVTEIDEKRFEKEIGAIMDKLSHSEREKKDLMRRLNDLERENQNQRSQLDRIKSSKVSTEDEKGKATENARIRMEEDFQRKLRKLEEDRQRELNQLRTTLSKDSNANTQLINENKRVGDRIRQLEREIEQEKRNSDNQRKQHERELESQKKQQERGSSQLSETMKTKIVNDYERKLADQKNAYENEITALRMSEGKESSHEIKILKDKIKKLEIELESSQKQVAVYQKSGLGATTYGSGSGSHVKYGSQIGSVDRYSEEPSEIKSPKGDSYKSGFEKQYISPSQSSVRSGDQQVSSVKSHTQMKTQQEVKFKAMMTMREFMNYDLADNRDRYSTLIMIKIVEKIESEVENKILNSYTPNNIYLIGFDPKRMQNLGIKFGAPITNRKNKNDGLYLSPEVHTGNSTTTKSIVFTLGVIWDELLHHQTFFKTVAEIEDMKYPFKMRDTKLNPVLKNTLFEMMNKDPVRRIELGETKRRISLHKYIASETRVIGKKKEDV